jgi:hypothetical protein
MNDALGFDGFDRKQSIIVCADAVELTPRSVKQSAIAVSLIVRQNRMCDRVRA